MTADVGVATTGAIALVGSRFVLAAILLSAALGKLRRPTSFVGEVRNYRLVPQRLVTIVAGTVMVMELGTGSLLAGDVLTPWAGGAAAVLLTAFAAAMTVNMLRHRQIACGCSGTDRDITWGLVGRDLVLAAAAVTVAVSSPSVPPGELVAVLITVVAWLAGVRLVRYVHRASRLQRLLIGALARESTCPGLG